MAEEHELIADLAAARAGLDHVEDSLADLIEDTGLARPETLPDALVAAWHVVDELLWLHAEAAYWRDFDAAAAESAEEDNNRLRVENSRLLREREFEANPDPLTESDAGSRDNIKHPLCACASPEQLAAFDPKWRGPGPQCAVHPEEGGQ